MTQNERSLSGAVASITGASRGIGRGIAIELGAAGATVYFTVLEGGVRQDLYPVAQRRTPCSI